jgi:hypothetical protein
VTHQDFERLVERLEAEARRSPRGYRLRVAALASLAYLYVFAVAGAALAVVAGLVFTAFAAGKLHAAALKLGGKLGWALLGLVAAIGRALWVRLDPQGASSSCTGAARSSSECSTSSRAASVPRPCTGSS